MLSFPHTHMGSHNNGYTYRYWFVYRLDTSGQYPVATYDHSELARCYF